MLKRFNGFKALLFILFLSLAVSAQTFNLSSDKHLDLGSGWLLQSSCKVSEGGEAISQNSFQPKGWYQTNVPSTVLAAQVAAGEFQDPYYAMNLRKIPGATYPIGETFANLPMPKDSPYACSWWYRTEFRVPTGNEKNKVWLNFGGINYRANIWLNGRKLADSKDVAGAYRTYEFDITSFLLPGKVNTLAVETFAPTEKDLGINWVDWNPAPPDKNMGLWGDVYLAISGPVSVRYPQAVTHFTDDTLKRAELTVIAEVKNGLDQPVEGILEGSISTIRFQQKISLAASEKRTVRFTPDQFLQLRIDNPKIWWPARLGPQNLHSLSVSFTVGEKVSDSQTVRFGIREITSELNEKGYRLFRLNRRPIFIRGGGWAQDMLLRRPSKERLKAQFDYVRDLNLNTIRLEGKLESEEFYNLADEMGILVMAGWCCCDHWERWDKWKPGDLNIATECVRSQILRMRGHPSMLVWLNASDMPPPENVERAYIKALEDSGWPNPYISSASATPTKVTGPSGVKMTGPYDYVAPSYWLMDTSNGGAYGFNTETGPGPAIPTIPSLKRMIPADHLWPIDEYWNFHAGGHEFTNLRIFNSAMKASYGEPKGLEDYVNKAQAMTYASERAMFESYTRNKYNTTGVVQWMLNNAWPSIIWHLYDYYLHPAGGYFAVKKACEPLHVQYSYDDHGVVVVNSLYQPFNNLKVTARLYDFDLREKVSREAKLDATADSSQRAFIIPAEAFQGAQIYFLQLTLNDAAGKIVSSNFYWLPSKYTEFNWRKTTFVNTPASSHEDLRMLAQLPRVNIQASGSFEKKADETHVWVELKNPSKNLAFQVHLQVSDNPQKEEVAPIFWDDNYISLMPGESKTVGARFGSTKLDQQLVLMVDGMNIETLEIPLTTRKLSK